MTNAKKQEKRSPLRQMPLRNPGESLQEEIQAPPQPVPVTLTACLVIACAAYHTIRLRPRLKSLQLGLQGEKTVGQSLEALRSRGCRVFHDIPAKGFNVDHVIIGPQGVFAVETKTFSKPAQGDASVTYDGEKVLVGGREPDRNPLVQARASRDWLRDLLLETTAIRYPVRGVVVLPGWWVEPPGEKKRSDVWVLNPKALPAILVVGAFGPPDEPAVRNRVDLHILLEKAVEEEPAGARAGG